MFSVHRAGFHDLDLQVAAIEAKKSLGLEQGWEGVHCEQLEHNTVLMPIIARVLIHVDRAAFGAFSFLHGNLLFAARPVIAGQDRLTIQFSGRYLVFACRR